MICTARRTKVQQQKGNFFIKGQVNGTLVEKANQALARTKMKTSMGTFRLMVSIKRKKMKLTKGL